MVAWEWESPKILLRILLSAKLIRSDSSIVTCSVFMLVSTVRRGRGNSRLTKEETIAQGEGQRESVEVGATWISSGTQANAWARK